MPATPTLANRSAADTAPADDILQVTPADGADIAAGSRALVIGTAGALKITTAAGNTVTLTGVPAGVLPVKVTRVWATGTTAANIAALY